MSVLTVPAGKRLQQRLPGDAHDLFRREGDRLVRVTFASDGGRVESSLPDAAPRALDPTEAFELSWLRSWRRPRAEHPSKTIRCADIFCGVGGLSVGLEEAAWALDAEVEHALAVDVDHVLLNCFESNFDTDGAHSEPIEDLVDGTLGAPPTVREAALRERIGDLDLLLAGPPCQGHSDLNNHTRRDDPRNALFLSVVRLVELCQPRAVLIENVPGALRDKSGVVGQAWDHLSALGYSIDVGVVDASEVGVAQKRRRFFLIGSRSSYPSITRAVERGHRTEHSVLWAIADLGVEGEGVFDSAAVHSSENQRRISYLFEHDLHDLPDGERPACHREKEHSYRAVYGRMHLDEPAPTITVGFGSTGQGRFVHPLFPRTLTPHEAARVQSFPDWFDFDGLRRGQLQKAIGNAVPPRMASVIIRELLEAETG